MQFRHLLWQQISCCCFFALLLFPLLAGGASANEALLLEERLFAKFANPDFADPDSATPWKVLSTADRLRYQRIFTLQQNAQWPQARALINQLDNRLLMGYVDYQRLMHPTGWRSSFTELADWLDAYADHQRAHKIYRLAKKRRPVGNTRALTKPTAAPMITGNAALRNLDIPPQHKKLKKPEKSITVLRIQAQIRRNIANEVVTVMWRRLQSKEWRQHFSDTEYLESLGDIAKGYVIYQRDDRAIAVAREALSMGSNFPSQAYWWAGLAAWRQGDYVTAAAFFRRLGSHPQAITSLASASNFWAWRALLQQEKLTEAHQSLVQASTADKSFYGQLAQLALGISPDSDWLTGMDTDLAEALLKQHPMIYRLIALSEVGWTTIAQAEFDRMQFAQDLPTLSAFALIADRSGMAHFAIKVGHQQNRLGVMRNDVTLYPLPRWSYHPDYTIDRAFLYALIRKESLFAAHVTSRAGAEGLMQLMPSTARMMQRRLGLSSANNHNPAHNLMLGQEYLRYLMTLPEINYNLIYALAGYNAGPGRLIQWRKSVPNGDDPLLFLETIPVRETREYIENVLADMWIYRQRLGQDTPTKALLLENRWPVYSRLDTAYAD